jgi:hypothetical protein
MFNFMPFLYPILAIAGVGGVWWFSSSSGSAAGTEAGKGISDAVVIVGIATGVAILIYAVHKSGGKR